MPPFRCFWPYYLIVGALAIGLIAMGKFAFSLPSNASSATAYILAAGVVMAFVSILATSLSNWRSARIQQTFSAVQTLRTDREYLINALRVEAEPGIDFGAPLTPELIAQFKEGEPSSDVNKPAFGQAARFVLNQYEFIAAATRLGQLDEVMLRNTIRGGFGALVRTFAPVIAEQRRKNEETMANLVWLYRRFYPAEATDLGPGPDFADPLEKRIGWALGTRRLSQR